MEHEIRTELKTYRSISAIAREIANDWKAPSINLAAQAYLRAMFSLLTIRDKYGADSADDIVLRFLANAQGWRGPVAKRVKAELRQMLKDFEVRS